MPAKPKPEATEKQAPECGDYCDACGDCLYCYDEEPCFFSEDGKHSWVKDDDDD